MVTEVKSGWYCFEVIYKQEEKILNLIKLYLEKDNYPRKKELIDLGKIDPTFSLRNFIEGLGLPRNFNFANNKAELPYSNYIFLKIKECNVQEFNDFLRVIKYIPEVKDVIGQKFDVRPNKRVKPYIFKTYPIVLREKHEKDLRSKVQQFEYESDVQSITLNAPYLVNRQGLFMRVTTLNIVNDVVIEVRDKKDRRFKVNVTELSKVKDYNYT